MLYQLYELAQTAMKPTRFAAGSAKYFFRNPFNPMAHTALGRSTAAAAELIERTTRRYQKPVFGINRTKAGGRIVGVRELVVLEKPFCRLIHFSRALPDKEVANTPRVLIVAPLSGHHATLLRGTVEGLLPNHEVYITDWTDARMVPAKHGSFGLDDYVDYLIEMIRLFKGDVHVMGVCQPSVPVLMAVAHMEALGDPEVPRSMILLGGPIDTRISPTAVNKLAVEKGIDWFRKHVITTVPWRYPGRGRRVYPGFLQLSGFIAMNPDKHMSAHQQLFFNLVKGDGESAEKTREFYDEYLAVMDMAAEYYLETVDQIFIQHALARGQMRYRGALIDPSAIRNVALMTVEGEKDDITGLGQCRAAHGLCANLAGGMRKHHLQSKVGHYGIFNGSRFRADIVPAISAFTRRHDPRGGLLKRVFMQIQDARKIEVAPLPLAAGNGGTGLPIAGLDRKIDSDLPLARRNVALTVISAPQDAGLAKRFDAPR
ncbi:MULTISPECIES: polyhydroxyalkanoate depolymerase [Rhodomicrobium]|uniref:polyhydroxyalkanoate depolymerase n=1 Tax=Rhodomicrobium TaxID=1068 RepID=UPI000B4AECED|nr:MULTISPECIES: polyhydroxyalkanoate depolymerase [Rhodomicrobium]